MKIKYVVLIGMVFSILLNGCSEYLDEKPEQDLLVPSTLEDVRLLLDNPDVFNRQPVLTLHSGDEFFLGSDVLLNLSASEQGAYLWLKDPFQGERSYDWETCYEQVFYANVALDALDGIEDQETDSFRALKGEALFNRAHAYYHLLQQFAPAYRLEGGNGELLGIVLKDSPDVNEKAVRANLEESYSQVIKDLTESVQLLPDLQLPKTRPGKAAAFGMLARVYLAMFDYQKAAESARNALASYPERLDFKELDTEARNPFIPFGDEVVYYSQLLTVRLVYSSGIYVDSTLIEKYQEGDLRLPLYFEEVQENRFQHVGKLTGNVLAFGGISTGELELIAAEAFARIGKEEESREYLNSLLSRRISAEFFEPEKVSGEELLEKILLERRKELVGRGMRWVDLRRLNQYEESKETLEKMVGGELYVLDPDSKKYVFPIPDEEINFTGIETNER